MRIKKCPKCSSVRARLHQFFGERTIIWCPKCSFKERVSESEKD